MVSMNREVPKSKVKQVIYLWSLLSFIPLGMSCSHVSTTGKARVENTVNTVLWYQNAGEVKALYHQAFNVARMNLDRDLRSGKKGKRRAVVVDVDETIVDNSPYQARAIVTGETYPTGWAQWMEMAQAQALPGAVEFLRYADKKGVSVFYITNRKSPGREATIKNLRALGFPVKEEHVMLRTKSRSKVARRGRALEDHRIVLLMGDTLGDFDEIFEHKTQEERNDAVSKMGREFGRRFIMLPNPMYGDWEEAAHKGQRGGTEREKSRRRRKALRYY